MSAVTDRKQTLSRLTGALPENLIESELFGSRKGAFTGANENRIGKLEFAQGGTVFLDEIESMPLAMQVKLLRVIEERKVTPVGSNIYGRTSGCNG